jgi:HSP20 family molecular chaperone IbpA
MADMTTAPQKGRVEESRPETTRGGPHFVPRVDICETEAELFLHADVPGARAEDVDLHYENGELMLHVRVPRRLPQAGLLLREYDEGDFYRVFSVHESIDASRIEAQCKNGVLTVRLPKAEAIRPRQIKVTAQ